MKDFTKTLLLFAGIVVAIAAILMLSIKIGVDAKMMSKIVIVIIVAVIVYSFKRGRRQSAPKDVKNTDDLGLPIPRDPNIGYIKGARFGVKDPLDQIVISAIRGKDKGMDEDEVIAAACLAHGAKPNDRLIARVRAQMKFSVYDLVIGDIFVPLDAETKGFLIVGRPGTGKTQIISQILDVLKFRGSKAIVHDHKSDYLASFYNPETDVIFNPLDARCVPWDVFSRVVGPWDLESIATALIPPAPGNVDQHWTDAARNVLIGAMTYLMQEGRACNEELKKLIADKNELAKIITDNNLRGSEHLIGFPDNKESQSVMSTFGRFTNCLAYLPSTNFGDTGVTFDFDTWLSSDKPGTIFVTNYQRTEDALRPLLSLFIESFIRTILSLPDDLDRRIYVLLDEFGRLNRLPSTSSLITQGRSKGCCTFLGIQDLAQIETKYSKTIRQSISNSLGSHVVLQVVDPETADYFSREFGEVTRWRTDYTETSGESSATSLHNLGGSHRSSSSRTHQVTERLILPSEILGLQKLQAIVRLVDSDVLATNIPILKLEQSTEPFILNEKFAFKKKATTETTSEPSESTAEEATEVNANDEIEDL
jgi:type IV secretory pathway TraG/TraD family ATPase VirD4